MVLHWRKLGLLMVGPYKHWVKYAYNEPLALLQERDCCRILTAERLELLQGGER